VIPAPKMKIAEYEKRAQWGKQVWMKHGALQDFECVADDLNVHPGCGDFKTMVPLEPSERLWSSFIVYRNKKHRDAVNKKVFAEMQTLKMPKSMPFDVKRGATGGSKTIVRG